MSIGEEIRAARQAKKLTQKQLAALVINPTTGQPITPSAISEIERGSVEPRPVIMGAIGRVLGIGGDSFFLASDVANRTLRATWGLTYVQQSGEYVAAPLPEGSPMGAHTIEHVNEEFGAEIWGMVVDGGSIAIPSEHRVGPLDEFILEPADHEPMDTQMVIVRRVGSGDRLLRVVKVYSDGVHLRHPDGEDAGDTFVHHPSRWDIVALVKQHRRTW